MRVWRAGDKRPSAIGFAMDPLTQGVLGAALPQSTATSGRRGVVAAGCFGFLAGLAPDLDVLIRSDEDPLLFLEYHRQFTHSLFFIPVGGLLTASILHLAIGRRLRLAFSRTLLFCTLGYGTHGLLDYATSYGTMLFWPFSHDRYAANLVSIVDPLFTVPAAVLVVAAGLKRSALPARLALLWVCLYLGLAAVQHGAALRMAREVATARGHAVERQTVKPSFANILVWRSVYEADGRFFVDGLRAGVAPRVFPGTSVARLDPESDFPWLSADSQQYRDLLRFTRLSHGYAARSVGEPETVIDVRYAFLPHELGALWSIALTPDAPTDRHVRFQTNRGDARSNLAALWAMITADAAR